MHNFDFVAPTTLPEALAALSAEARPIAGGTDLLTQMKDGLIAPATLINLQTVGELNGIHEDEAGLRIGAGTPIADLLAWPTLMRTYPMLALACQYVAWPEIRTMGTIGGNLCQRPRCWYFRHPLATRCLKRGGDFCYPLAGRADGHYAIFGGGPCYAVHPSDIAPALVALNATLTLASPTAQHVLPVADFFSSEDVLRENILQSNELIVALHVPRPAPNTRATFLKSKRRQSHDFARASLALSLVLHDGVCVDARLVLGSVALKPWRLNDVEQLLRGQRLDVALIREASQFAVHAAQPLISTNGTSNAAKVTLVEGLVRKGLMGVM